jgi:hypothetical protein
MTTMDQARKRAEEAGSGGIFIRLADDGDKFVGAFLGGDDGVHVRELVWDKAQDTYRDHTPADEAAGVKPTPKFSMNVYVPAEKCVKVFEMTAPTFKDLCAIKDKYKGLDTYYFEVTRNGKKGNTKTTYRILPETLIPDADKAAIKGMKLHDLKKAANSGDASTDLSSHEKGTANGATNGTAAAPAGAAEVVDGETALAIVTRLKALSKEKIDAFLVKFQIKTIKALPKASVPAALEMLDTLEGKAPAVEDPLAL